MEKHVNILFSDWVNFLIFIVDKFLNWQKLGRMTVSISDEIAVNSTYAKNK